MGRIKLRHEFKWGSPYSVLMAFLQEWEIKGQEDGLAGKDSCRQS